MKMLLALIGKDFKLIKKYIFVLLAIDIVLPIFCLYKAAVLFEAGFTVFFMTFIFTVFMAMQSLAAVEMKYSKAEATLCSTPYSRTLFVISRYVFYIILYAATLIVYWLLSLVFNGIPMISAVDAFLSLLCGALFIGITLPVQYKIGYEKLKYVYMLSIMATPFVIPVVGRYLSENKIDLTSLFALPDMTKSLIALCAAVLFFGASMLLSVKIYKAKEL